MAERKKAILIVTLFFIVLGTAFGLLYFLKSQKLNQNTIEIRKYESAIKGLQQRLDYQSDTGNVSFVDTAITLIPPVKAIPQLVHQLNTYAKETGVSLVSVTFDEQGEEEQKSAIPFIGNIVQPPNADNNESETESVKIGQTISQQIPFIIDLEGSYDNLRSFAIRIQNSKRLMLITKWTLSNSEHSVQPMLTLELVAFYAPELEGKVTSPKDIPTYISPNKLNPFPPARDGITNQNPDSSDIQAQIDSLIKELNKQN